MRISFSRIGFRGFEVRNRLDSTLGIVVFASLLLLDVSALFASSANNSADTAGTQNLLKVVTINIWSGLDYTGFFRFGEYETAKRRELRLQLLIAQLRRLDPDVICIQEANPVSEYSCRLADSLGFDEVHQVCNAGIKFGGVGLPTNFDEGIAILARRNLQLRYLPPWKLSGSFGIYGGAITLNFDESEFAQVAQITVGGKAIYLVNVHLSAYPPDDRTIKEEIEKEIIEGRIDSAEAQQLSEDISAGAGRRVEEVSELLDHLAEFPAGIPVTMAGDFNSIQDSREMKLIGGRGEFSCVRDSAANASHPTWDPLRNPNIKFSTDLSAEGVNDFSTFDRLSAMYDRVPRTIDYIFLNNRFTEGSTVEAHIAMDESRDSVFASDHFGVFAVIDMNKIARDSLSTDNEKSSARSPVEPLPILSYDTDTHFGYGAKLFLFDLFKLNESFDIVLFNSTKGEQWYRFVFSIPDFESREGTRYPVALDLIFDYDKWLRNNFYGIGNASRVSEGEQYTRIPIDAEVDISRGFSPTFVGQVILKYMSVRNYNFAVGSKLATLPPALNSATVKYNSLGLTLRYDTRNSFINASKGVVLQGETEYSPRWSLGNTSFARAAGWIQYYSVLFYPTTVFALRIGAQQVFGSNIPVQVMSSLGGTLNLRGYPQDRFLDKSDALLNAELRFPIFWRIGGVAGIDAGKVWPSLKDIDFRNWPYNPLAGLRLYMDNYVVRVDIGFGREGTGFYFNFGQLF